MPRIGLVGAGFIAGIHAERYGVIPDADVTAVYAPAGAPALLEEHDLEARVVSSLDSLLEAVDVVDVCSPTHTHRRYVERAAEAGLDVICEKPLARTVTDAEAMVAAATEADTRLLVGHVLRYFPGYREVRDLVADGVVGEVGTVRARRHAPFPSWGSDDWFADDDRSGGVFLDLGIHEFDFLQWCVGPIERVFARRRNWGDHQHGHATLRFTSGAVGYIEAGWDRPPGGDLESDLEVAGDGGLLEHDGSTTTLALERNGDPPEQPVAEDGYGRELRSFIRCLEDGGETLVDPTEAVEAVRVAQAANRSAERGTPVDVAEVGP